MNITDSDILERMELLEGAEWRRRQETISRENPSDWEVGFYHALEVLVDLDGQTKSWNSIATIYGSGGFHRYYVDDEGSVRFSSSHATKEATKRAQKLGFSV